MFICKLTPTGLKLRDRVRHYLSLSLSCKLAPPFHLFKQRSANALALKRAAFDLAAPLSSQRDAFVAPSAPNLSSCSGAFAFHFVSSACVDNDSRLIARGQ